MVGGNVPTGHPRTRSRSYNIHRSGVLRRERLEGYRGAVEGRLQLGTPLYTEYIQYNLRRPAVVRRFGCLPDA